HVLWDLEYELGRYCRRAASVFLPCCTRCDCSNVDQHSAWAFASWLGGCAWGEHRRNRVVLLLGLSDRTSRCCDAEYFTSDFRNPVLRQPQPCKGPCRCKRLRNRGIRYFV